MTEAEIEAEQGLKFEEFDRAVKRLHEPALEEKSSGTICHLMRVFKTIGQILAKSVRRMARVPQAIAAAFTRRRGQIGTEAIEAERLDRIREPWKYRGK